MSFDTIDVFCGRAVSMSITSYGTVYEVPRSVYEKALVNPPANMGKFKHSIEPKIDGVCYGERAVELIILFMHHAAIGEALKKCVFTDLPREELSKLPRDLAVISWCTGMVKTSETYEAYVEAARKTVRNMVALVRALVADGDESMGGIGKRLELLRKTGLPVEAPEYLKSWILLPATNGDRDEVMRIIRCDKEIYIAQGGVKTDSGYYLFRNGSWKHLPKGVINTDIVVDMQYRLQSDILKLQLRLLCHEHPNYMKIEGFGRECAGVIESILTEADIKLHHAAKPEMTICHVFEHGLAAALTAEYS